MTLFPHEQKLCLDSHDLTLLVLYLVATPIQSCPPCLHSSARVAIWCVNLGMSFLYFLWATQPSLTSPFLVTSPLVSTSYVLVHTTASQQTMLFCQFLLYITTPWVFYPVPLQCLYHQTMTSVPFPQRYPDGDAAHQLALVIQFLSQHFTHNKLLEHFPHTVIVHWSPHQIQSPPLLMFFPSYDI